MFDEQTSLTFGEVAGRRVITRPVTKIAKSRRDTIKAAGGAAYEELLRKGRAARAKYRRDHPGSSKSHRTSVPFKTYICQKARKRGRERGLPSTITADDLVWPSHCPVLGLELDYPERSGMRGAGAAQANWPSLDRWDSTKGYVPGNVFVISYRANTLKNSANYAEILLVAKYLSRRPK